jgi:hypothetical protein
MTPSLAAGVVHPLNDVPAPGIVVAGPAHQRTQAGKQAVQCCRRVQLSQPQHWHKYLFPSRDPGIPVVRRVAAGRSSLISPSHPAELCTLTDQSRHMTITGKHRPPSVVVVRFAVRRYAVRELAARRCHLSDTATAAANRARHRADRFRLYVGSNPHLEESDPQRVSLHMAGLASSRQ